MRSSGYLCLSLFRQLVAPGWRESCKAEGIECQPQPTTSALWTNLGKQVARDVANYPSKVLQKEGKEQNDVLVHPQPGDFVPVLVSHKAGEVA